ncbi:Uncharacterised protein [Campylobacter geochelonis]|uniref:Uncharacterized protein n=1 Tax=Campylobacter geochelonis TaxID=1780362 RepID=A0A128EBB6_9BACT|nr:Uncharacterised protein [Campylobacter geochelonis]
MFESCVNLNGSKTRAILDKADAEFESCVNLNGSKTNSLFMCDEKRVRELFNANISNKIY